MAATSPVAIPTTAPGQQVNISVDLQAPATPGEATGTWKIVNTGGTVVAGGQLVVDVNVTVQTDPTALQYIAEFAPDPASPSSASTVNFHAVINPLPTYRAMRFIVDNQVLSEQPAGVIDHLFSWNTAAAARGDHTVELAVADQSDLSWAHPEIQMQTYTLAGTPAPVVHAPNQPIPLTSTWAQTNGRDHHKQYGLPVRPANGDPNGLPITGYQFETFQSSTLWNSGWVSGPCVTTSALPYAGYQWHVMVENSAGVPSAWSIPWNFTIVDPTPRITTFTLTPRDSNSNLVNVDACGQAGIGGTLRVMANDASDGSDNGTWHEFYEQGDPCFSSPYPYLGHAAVW